MTDSFLNLLTTWDVPPLVTSALLLTSIMYVNGWIRIRRTREELFPVWRLVCFLSGVGAIFVAVASPLDTFSESLLILHMGQHFVFMSIAPPLVLLGAPVVPLLRGLPRWIVRPILGPIFRAAFLRRVAQFLIRPRVAWIAMSFSFVAWHVPKAY